MRMEFKVRYSDGREVTAVAKPRDIVAFERQYSRSMACFADEKNPPPMEWLYYLAWSPLHRMREESADFDGFLGLVDEIEPVEDAPLADPTQPEASDDSSPVSPSAAA